ncbi:hypothetical protein KM043_006017 [Ampulex compressa]|nr:hypothetical protein KM043_006017 [Ampulex compressa]
MASSGERIIVLIDMDCFFCQVETKLQPEFKGKPLAVVQYNQWKLGGIIAVNYEAREFGVTRHMRGEEAKEKCPDLLLASVPCLRGKADTSRYRTAGREVIDVIKKHCNIIERASVDEAYIDITDIVEKRMATLDISTKNLISCLSNTFIVGYSEIGKNDEEERRRGTKTWISNIFEELQDVQAQKLAIAGVIVEELRADIYETIGYRCSAGISQNKILAKLACGLHKPNRQTILPAPAVSSLYSTLPVKKVRNLGGKFGDVIVDSLGCNVMGDLLQYSLPYLQKRFDEKTGLWLYNIARGIDNEPVVTRLVSKSIGACKKFPGKQAIVTLDVLKHWAGDLAAEVCERLEQDLEENQRRATLLTICYHYYQNKSTISQSRSCALNSYKPEKMGERCVEIITKSTQCPIAFIGISAGKFIPAKGSGNFINFFKSSSTESGSRKQLVSEIQNSCSDTKIDEADSIITNKCKNVNTEMSEKILQTKKSATEDTKNHAASNTKSTKRDTCKKLDDSPTTQRLQKLIKSCNERNKEHTLYKNALNECHLNESLDQENFKESFFMNIFAPKKTTSEQDMDAWEVKRGPTREEDVDSLNRMVNLKNKLPVTSNRQCDKDDYLEEETVSSNNKPVNSIDTDNDASSTVNNRDVSNENDAGQRPQNDDEANDINRIYSMPTSSVRLSEIFPDLNNIDPSIVELLPSSLQEEARPYIKVQKQSNAKTSETSVKNSKVKPNNRKTNNNKGKEGKLIHNFLIKGRLNDTANGLLTRCPQCNQMIPSTKFNEHTDYHVAQDLQREINKTVKNDGGTKRKFNSPEAQPSTNKRRPNVDTCKTDGSYQSITSFFS